MLLSVKDVHVDYGQLEILKGVSFDIEEGQIGVLLGANGAGKTTLLKTISGLLRSKIGSIWFQGKRIDTLSAPDIVRAGIAHAPEGRRLFVSMSVRDNLEMGAYSRKNMQEINQDIDNLFERLPALREKQNEASGKLSGGEQQMLCIARALMAKPKLLLMDEPSQGLAPLIVQELNNVITGIKKDGTTLIIVEHNLRLGLSLADEVYVLENGEICLRGKPTDLSTTEYCQKVYLGG
jgi:branched-chain amino acid transport system ATP-binding protein